MDIFKLLKSDHKEVQDLLHQVLKKGDINLKQVEQVCQMLTIHMELEEKLFYSVLKKQKETHRLIDESYKEHDELKRLVRSIEKGNLNEHELKVKCEKLNQLITHHVDEEEGQLFPKAKHGLSDVQIDSMGKEFSQQKKKRMASV